MELKAVLMDEAAVRRCIARISHEIVEKNRGAQSLCLLGVKRRGIPLAKMIGENILRFEGIQVPTGQLDITRFRDDLEKSEETLAAESQLPYPVVDKDIILADDVIFTGRTARAAIEAVLHHGRPRSIQLAVLIDRGHREMPIRPDFVGKNIPTSRQETISVRLTEEETSVSIYGP